MVRYAKRQLQYLTIFPIILANCYLQSTIVHLRGQAIDNSDGQPINSHSHTLPYRTTCCISFFMSCATVCNHGNTTWKTWTCWTNFPPPVVLSINNTAIYRGWKQQTTHQSLLHRRGRRFESCSAHVENSYRQGIWGIRSLFLKIMIKVSNFLILLSLRDRPGLFTVRLVTGPKRHGCLHLAPLVPDRHPMGLPASGECDIQLFRPPCSVCECLSFI